MTKNRKNASENDIDIQEQQEVDSSLGEDYDDEYAGIAIKLASRELPMPEGFKIGISDGECYKLLTHLSPAGYYRCSFRDAAIAYLVQNQMK